jgi:hypothetical protein
MQRRDTLHNDGCVKGAWWRSSNYESQKEADETALDGCRVEARKNGIGNLDKIGYAAVANSTTRIELNIADTLEDAKRNALDNCARHTSTDDECAIVWTGVNGVIRN